TSKAHTPISRIGNSKDSFNVRPHPDSTKIGGFRRDHEVSVDTLRAYPNRLKGLQDIVGHEHHLRFLNAANLRGVRHIYLAVFARSDRLRTRVALSKLALIVQV